MLESGEKMSAKDTERIKEYLKGSDIESLRKNSSYEKGFDRDTKKYVLSSITSGTGILGRIESRMSFFGEDPSSLDSNKTLQEFGKNLDLMAAGATTVTAEAAQKLRQRFGSFSFDDATQAAQAQAFAEQVSRGGASDEELATSFKALAQSKDLGIKGMGQLGMMISEGKSEKDIGRAYTAFLSSVAPDITPEQRAQYESGFLESYRKGGIRGSAGVIAATYAAASSPDVPVVTGAKVGTGYISQEQVNGLITGLNNQSRSTDELIKIFNQINPKGFMGMDEEQQKKFGKVVGEAISKEINAKSVNISVGNGGNVTVAK
jgi:hypothetical protein